MVLDEVIRLHNELLIKGIFPRRIFMSREKLNQLYEELERQVMYIHTLSIVVTNKGGIWCE